MAVFMNAKGTQSSVFQIGKRGNKIFGATATPTASECSTGDLWFDISNNETKIATKSGDSVTWNKIITENFGDVTISGNLTVQGTQTTVNSTSVEIQNAFVFEGSSADAHETTLTTIEPTADNTIKLPNASGNLVLSGAIDVDDLVGTAYVATGEVWNDNDSELATTGRISDFIGTEIANSSVIMHTTGAESFAGEKTFTSDMTLSSTGTDSTAGPVLTFYRNSSSPADADYLGQLKFEGENDADEKIVYSKITGKILDASDGTEDGIIEFANKKAGTTTITARLRSDSLQLLNGTSLVVGGVTYPTADGSANQILQTDGSGTLSFATNTPTPAGSNTHVQFNDGGAIAGNSNLVFDKATNRLTVTNLTVNSQFSFTSDYGSIESAVTVTDTFGLITNDARKPTPHDSYTVTEAGNITGKSAGDMIFVSNETGGATMAFYDGTNWRRVQDRAIIS